MRTFKGILTAGAMALCLAGSAQAADWQTGVYIGINGGAGWDQAKGGEGGGNVGYRGGFTGLIWTADVQLDGGDLTNDKRYQNDFASGIMNTDTVALGIPLGSWLPSVEGGFASAPLKSHNADTGYTYGLRLEHVFTEQGHDYVFRIQANELQYGTRTDGEVKGPVVTVGLLMPL
jgi:hypothetical protein